MDANPTSKEVYFSVDIETAGPNPADYSMLTIGACKVNNLQRMFYVELQPVSMKYIPDALEISRLSMERLAKRGIPAKAAMLQFDEWVRSETAEGEKPVFVAFNAAFDWMFVNDYFHRYLGRNPFGHTALDIKSFFMGLAGSTWEETAMRYVGPRYLGNRQLTHHALRDAMDQAQIFSEMLEEAKRRLKDGNLQGEI
jgi:DNA polymerase III epsilon subunit-like protein